MKKNYIVLWGTVVREIRDGRPVKCNWGEIWRELCRGTQGKSLCNSFPYLTSGHSGSHEAWQNTGPDVICTVCPRQACPFSCLIHWKCALPPSSTGNAFCLPSLALLSKQGLHILCTLSWHLVSSFSLPYFDSSFCLCLYAQGCIKPLEPPLELLLLPLAVRSPEEHQPSFLTLLTEHIMSLCLPSLILCRVPYQRWLFIKF